MDKEAEAKRVNKELEKVAQRIDNNVTHAVRELTKEDWGRDFLWWLLRIGRVGQSPFNVDPHIHAHNTGELNVGLQVLARITETEPAGYFRMLEDQLNYERERIAIATAKPDAESRAGGDTFHDPVD